MQFWNEMEGKTVADRYVLGRLLRSEGRSAWFAAKDDGRPAALLLTESLNDDDRLSANLEAASKIKHPNVISIFHHGRAVVDTTTGKTPVVYAVLEPTEENLGDVLRERPLTADETAEISTSLVAALKAVHDAGMLHGHVSAANVFATGDTVKLRSDCAQKLTSEAAGKRESFARDTSDLGATLFEALTQKKLASPQDATIERLPVPFRAIVKNTTSGSWGLTEVLEALKKPYRDSFAAAAPTPVAKQEPVKTTPVVPAKPAAAPLPKAVEPVPVARAETKTAAEAEPVKAQGKPAVRIFATIALVAALAVIWYFYHTRSSTAPPNAIVTDTNTSAPPNAQTPSSLPDASPSSVATAHTTSPSTAPPVQPKPSASGRSRASTAAGATTAAATGAEAAAPGAENTVWRVVIYTYGREADAQAKVESLETQHPELKPEVFTPTGHAPWLVTVGGAMSRRDAYLLRTKMRNQGMPQDTYMQNFAH